MNITSALKDQWAQQHSDCDGNPPPMPLEEARCVLTAHAGHGSECRQFATALDCVTASRI